MVSLLRARNERTGKTMLAVAASPMHRALWPACTCGREARGRRAQVLAALMLDVA